MALRPWLRRYGDLLLGVVLGSALTVELLVRPGGDVSLSVAAGMLVALGLSLRRRAALAGFLISALGLIASSHAQPGFEHTSTMYFIDFVVVLYSLGAHARGRDMWIGAGLVAVGVVWFVAHDGDSFHVGDIGFGMFLVGGPWAAGLVLRLRREREARLREANAALAREQEQAAHRAVVAERARIARELHDVVSHAIAVTVLQSRGARRVLGHDEAAVRRALDAIEQTNTQALSDMRRLLAVLRDTESEADVPAEPEGRAAPQPSLAHLDHLVAQVRESGLPVEVQVSGPAEPVPPGVDLSAYRIIQEALVNTLKHAGPDARARVRVDYGVAGLAVEVRDDGRDGHGPGPGTGHGLIGIRERVAVVGGEVEAGPAADGGFVVRARLPYAVEGLVAPA